MKAQTVIALCLTLAATACATTRSTTAPSREPGPSGVGDSAGLHGPERTASLDDWDGDSRWVLAALEAATR